MSNARYQIRPAQYGDQRILAEMGKMFFEEYMPHLTYDRLSMQVRFADWLVNNDSFVSYILDDRADDVITPVGMSMGMLGNSWCYADSVFEEMAWYVLPEFRGKTGTAAFRLLWNLYCDAKRMGARVFKAGEHGGNPSILRIYAKLGMVPVETSHQCIIEV